jgi:hypothetical protein
MGKRTVGGANGEPGSKIDPHGKASEIGQEQDRTTVRFCQYQVVSIKKEVRQASCPGATWYTYVVGNGSSTITGHRPGTREEVREHVNSFVAELNARGVRGGKSVWPLSRGQPSKESTKTDDK